MLHLQSLFSRPFVVMCLLDGNESGKKIQVGSKPGVGKLVQMVLPSNQKKVHKKATAPSSHARWLHKNQPKGCITAAIDWTQVVSQ